MAHFTEATTAYWQHLLHAEDAAVQAGAPWRYRYPARLPNGQVLMLPIRELASQPAHAVASLLLNQASLTVVDTLGQLLAQRLSALKPEVVIGLPTLGLSLAPVVTRALGLCRYVPLGYSRKFWYLDALSAPVHSMTSPEPGKRVYLDPHLLPLLQGRRAVLIDDVVSTGTTLRATWELLASLDIHIVASGVAMRQGQRWVNTLGAERAARVVGVFDSPLLQAVPEGWVLRD